MNVEAFIVSQTLGENQVRQDDKSKAGAVLAGAVPAAIIDERYPPLI